MLTAPASGDAWYTDISSTTTLTCVLVVLQILYLLRKWWREESEWGVKLRDWAERHGITKPAPLE